MVSDYTPPTLEDVAKQAGVSTATVSRCLNTSEKVSEKNRLKVKQAIDLLGYTPHFGARAMAAKRTYTIGAIIPTMENAIFARGIQAFQEQLNELGYTLLVASSAYSPKREAEQVKALVARGADALLLIGYERDPAIYEFLERRNIPTLISWAYSRDADHPAVGFDNFTAMRRLTEKVLSFGHQSVGVITGTVAGNDRASARLDGIRSALADAGLTLPDTHIIETPYSIETGADAFETLMHLTDRPSVVMCGNDVLAAGALSRARDMALDVPGDVSMTGFDDIDLARVVHPALTTMRVPHRRMGKTAARQLIDALDGPAHLHAIEIETTLMLRGSLAAPHNHRT